MKEFESYQDEADYKIHRGNPYLNPTKKNRIKKIISRKGTNKIILLFLFFSQFLQEGSDTGGRYLGLLQRGGDWKILGHRLSHHVRRLSYSPNPPTFWRYSLQQRSHE